MVVRFFSFIGMVICFSILTIYQKTKEKKFKERIQNIESTKDRMFATYDDIDDFRSKSDEELLDDVSVEMTEMFGENWKDKFIWNEFKPLFSASKLNTVLGWDAVAALYYAKRGKIVGSSYEVLSNRKEDSITFCKYIEKLIQKKSPRMKLIFVYKMTPDCYERGKWHVNPRGNGRFEWDFYFEDIKNGYEVKEYLW